MKDYFNWENIKFKLKYFIFPQFLSSLLTALLYPLFIIYIFPLLNIWIARKINWTTFNTGAILFLLLVPFVVIVIYYILFGRKLIKIFSFDGFRRKFSTAILPVIFGFISSIMILGDHTESQKRMYKIKSSSLIKNIKDSTELYEIEKYYIRYDDYYYKVELEDVERGGRWSRHYETEMITYIICPILDNNSKLYTNKSQKLWVGFQFSKQFSNQYKSDSPIISQTEKEHLMKFNDQSHIYYFEETKDDNFYDLVLGKVKNDTTLLKNVKVLKANFEEYEPYDGFKYLLISAYILLGGNLFVFIAIFFAEINEDERNKILSKNLR